MRKSRVKGKWRRGEPACLTTAHLTDPSVYEMIGLMGFDGIWMDMEHHAYTVETAGNLMRAARVGSTDCMVRPAKGEFMRMGRMLEAGAAGIMYPRCESPAEAREVVKWSKFAPLGARGFDGGNPDMPYCMIPMDQYVKQANEETFVVVQLEDKNAVEHAYEIASVEGVDAILLGPADFTVLNGIPGQFNHPLVQEATKKVAAAAKAAGKEWGRPAGTIDDIKRFMDMGSRFILHGCDLVYIKSGWEKMQKDLSALGFTFDNRIDQGGQSYLTK